MNVTIVRNPRAGRGHPEDVAEAVKVLERAGWTVEVCDTQAPGDATRLAAQATEDGRDAVLVAGGDGTINEAVQALAGTDTALGYLPHGTVNIWAREMRIPMNMRDAAAALAGGRLERIDLGVAGDRYFLLMAGIGFDARVVQRTQHLERHKQRLGILPYVATGLTTATVYRGTDVELRFDGIIRRVQALMLVVGNTRLYGGRFQFTPTAIANDGWLDLCIIKGRGPLSLARQSLPLLLSGKVDHTDVELTRIRELDVHAEVSLPVQVDGELAGTTPVHFRVAPRSLQVLVPRNIPSGLLV